MARPIRKRDVFDAVANPIRRLILRRLLRDELTVEELRSPLSISQPALSRHLAVLREAGLVRCRRRGVQHLYRLKKAPLRVVANWATECSAVTFSARAN